MSWPEAINNIVNNAILCVTVLGVAWILFRHEK